VRPIRFRRFKGCLYITVDSEIAESQNRFGFPSIGKPLLFRKWQEILDFMKQEHYTTHVLSSASTVAMQPLQNPLQYRIASPFKDY
jgi:hypothetical protein